MNYGNDDDDDDDGELCLINLIYLKFEIKHTYQTKTTKKKMRKILMWKKIMMTMIIDMYVFNMTTWKSLPCVMFCPHLLVFKTSCCFQVASL